MEAGPGQEKIRIYEVDLSEAWNSDSEAELLIEEVKKLGLYSPNLRFCGFDAEDIGNRQASDEGEDVVFCSEEKGLVFSPETDDDGALKYAFSYEKPALALYDVTKLEEGVGGDFNAYRILSDDALVAIIKIKTKK